jgi:hypothetical protein
MKMRKIFYFFCFSFLFILCTCNDPVFYAISQEVEPIEPRIKGSPTNFAIYDGRMYVASGKNLFSYNKGTDKPYWDKEESPEGNILQIASTGDNLFALFSTDKNNNGKTVIKRYNKDNSSWTKIGGILDNYNKIHNIFASGGILFIYASASSSNYIYSILYLKDDTINVLKFIDQEQQEDTGELNGVVFNGESFFLSFISKKTDDEKYSGVYKINDLDEGAVTLNYSDEEGKNVNFTGIINLEDDENTIILISRKGEIYTVNDSIVKIENISMGKSSMGALAIWRENDQDGCNRLLLAGRQDSLNYSSTYSYTYGYMELELDTVGIRAGSNFVEPGKNPISSLTDYERYKSTIGKYPVNYLFQVPADIDNNMILFAATQKNGVWSCRDRDNNNNSYWNAEGENEP